MPGKRINDQQYYVYIKARSKGMTQVTSAAKAGFSERTGRNLEKQGIPPSRKEQKTWQRRNDPFMGVWDELLVPLLERSPSFTGVILLEYLQDLYPGQYPDRHLRCLQKRIKHWKALYGPEKEVMFRQSHPPGKRGLSDFTHPKTFQVTIRGEPLQHLLYHYRLACSQWSFIKVVLGGESFTALAQGLQDALWQLGGCPEEHRTDSLSAAFKNLCREEREDITQRYESLCDHYGMKVTRNNRGKSHENGSIEGPHGHLKRRLCQALALRGSYDFNSIEEYQQFIDRVVERHNRRHYALIEEERAVLNPLPCHKTCDFEEVIVRVTTSSTIMVKKGLYSVPPRLIGERLRVHVYDRHLSCYLGGDHIINLPRVFAKKGTVKKCIDYRHLISNLVRKPQAFRYSVLRDDLLPGPVYREIWHLIDQRCTTRHACKLMVGLLKLAAEYDCETEVGEKVLKLLKKDIVPSLGDLQRRYESPSKRELPGLFIPQHSLASYNQLLSAKFREGWDA